MTRNNVHMLGQRSLEECRKVQRPDVLMDGCGRSVRRQRLNLAVINVHEEESCVPFS